MLQIINFISDYRMYLMPVLCLCALAVAVFTIRELWLGFKQDFFND